MGAETHQAWVGATAALWPGAHVAAVAPGESAGARRELAFLPDAERPRLLVPAGLPRAAATALRRYSHDLGLRERVTRGLVATAVRTGLPERRLRDRLRITGGGPSVEDRLADLLGRPVVVSIGLGNARANRKPILHVLSPGGEPVAFVKVGDNPTTRDLIAREAAALAYLAEHPPAGVHVPRVLHHGAWEGMDLLVLEPLPTSALGRRPRGDAPVAEMRALFEVGGAERAVLRDSPFWASVTGDAAAIADADQRERFTAVVADVEKAHGGRALEFGAWHGDWTPWNMAWHRGRLRLWDWERFARPVPAGFDLLHYRLQEAMRVQPGPAYAAWPDGADAALAPVGLTGADADATVHLYLLELCRRYLLAAQEPIGEPLRADADRLLHLLHAGPGRTS
ncbi:phosphotransferase [Actinomadura rayongensis]|uniref:Phosphotransferase n=1 Tax=Actinomadura rayongensis TaxID=1429076 RepID=A0A6I4W4V7_9ACTN|nr:phosphotransferase [Actinomadura rayongensis]MXQ64481.1 phosphotransferase [Actinomadura rayongensis]